MDAATELTGVFCECSVDLAQRIRIRDCGPVLDSVSLINCQA